MMKPEPNILPIIEAAPVAKAMSVQDRKPDAVLKREKPKASKFEKGLMAVADFFSALLFATLLGLLVFSILARDILHFPTPWLEEITTLTAVYAVAFASIGAWLRGAHIAVDIVPMALKGRWKTGLKLFLQIFSIFFFVAATYGALEMLDRSQNNRTTALALSYSYYYAGLVIAFGGMLIAAVIRTIEMANGDK